MADPTAVRWTIADMQRGCEPATAADLTRSMDAEIIA
jgi:hypothetical protein